MIKIELSFATYSDAIRALEAVNALALVNPAPQRDTPSGTVRPKAGTPEEQVKAHAEAVKAEEGSYKPIQALKPKAEPKAEPTADAPKVEYKDVQAAVLALSQIDANEADEADRTGRVAVQAILKEMGLATFKGSPEEVWPTAVQKLKAKLAELKEA